MLKLKDGPLPLVATPLATFLEAAPVISNQTLGSHPSPAGEPAWALTMQKRYRLFHQALCEVLDLNSLEPSSLGPNPLATAASTAVVRLHKASGNAIWASASMVIHSGILKSCQTPVSFPPYVVRCMVNIGGFRRHCLQK